MLNINVVFMGTPDFAVPILEMLIKNAFVSLVVTQPDAYVGRKKILTYSPIKKLAITNKIPVFQPKKIRTEYEEIKKYKPDLIITCAYGQIVPKEVLEIPSKGCLNVHASLLPKYRGGAPIHHAIINGNEKTGITIMYMDEGMDTGDIVKMASIAIENNDTTASMHDKLSKLGASLLEEVLPDIISGTNERIKQNDAEATYAHVITRVDEHLDFSLNALDIYNKVRGLYSWPLAYIILNDEEIKILDGYIGEDVKEKPGTIVRVLKDAIGIACQDKIYYVTKIKPSGKKEMLVKDYLNGIDKNKLLKEIVK